jgi:hypothetical protein
MMDRTASLCIHEKARKGKLKLDEHLAKARHNWAFLTEIEGFSRRDGLADWSVVVLYYSALHLVDALLHANGFDHGQSHSERNDALRALVRARRMSRLNIEAYLRLASRARAARYSEATLSRAEYEQLIAAAFRVVEGEVRGRLQVGTLRSPAFRALTATR